MDVDAQLTTATLEQRTTALQGVKIACGASLSNPEIALLAAEQGIEIIVTEPILPALLALSRLTS